MYIVLADRAALLALTLMGTALLVYRRHTNMLVQTCIQIFLLNVEGGIINSKDNVIRYQKESVQNNGFMFS